MAENMRVGIKALFARMDVNGDGEFLGTCELLIDDHASMLPLLRAL